MHSLFEIAKQENFSILSHQTLSGGDINQVFLLTTSLGKLVIKLNPKNKFPSMFEEEADALNALAQTNTFKIPNIISVGEYIDDAYLIMEYIKSGKKEDAFWNDFGMNLAKLHQHTHSSFGWKTQNFIGSLPQYNAYCSQSAEFYITQRLQPQLQLAAQNGFDFQHLDLFFKNVELEIPAEEVPALIHGDLWSGNYFIAEDLQPVLIDPAVSYASREMDLAMMQLFGGFPPSVFEVYQYHFPLLPNWKSRVELYQLYYLLVHLNLFGRSYLNSVQQIIQKYT